MFLKRIGLLGVIAALGLGTAACTDGYGYSGLGVGYGAGYGGGYGYADPYYGGGYGGGLGGPGLGYGAGNFGWYNDFYYPGSGTYVYDRYRRPFRWNDGQRRYWLGRGGGRGNPNWGGFNRNWNDGRGYNGYNDGRGYNGYNDGRGWNGRGNWNGRRDGYDRRDNNRGNWRGRYGNNVAPNPDVRFNDGRTAPSGVRTFNRNAEARAAIRSQRMETRAATRNSISRRQNPNVRPE